nr:ABC-2 family transporter protein [Candidatus Woesebacteria bacterium]
EYDLPDITTYYLIGLILANVTEVHFEGWRSEEIRLGTIDRYLTKPYHYLTEVILGESVGKTLYAILFLPLFALFALWAYQTTGVGHVVLNATTLLSFLFVAFCAYLIQLGLGIFITLLTFWFEGAQGLEHFKWLSITLLSGTLMPLEFLPEWLQHLTSALPFKYLYAVPIGVMQGRYELGISDLGNIVITLSLLGFAIAILWKKGIKHYCSAGG